MEQEEYYVAYLERLLADVERQKISEPKSPAPKSPCGFSSSENSLHDSSTADCVSPRVEKSSSPIPKRDDISQLQDKCVSELSSTLSTSQRPKSEIPRNTEKVPVFRRNSDPDVPSNYITVIEVGNSKKEKIDDLMKEEDEKGKKFFFVYFLSDICDNDNENEGGELGI